MTPRELRCGPVAEALALLPAPMSGAQAEAMLLAIAMQESELRYRRQHGNGPARSLWQAERGGGMVSGLLRYHDHRVRDLAVGLCAVRGVSPDAMSVWTAIEHDDVLAAGLARLLLWTDPARLPRLGDEEGAWQLYLRTWRPGAFDRGTPAQRAELRQKWARNYARALAEVQQ
ncbi:hypothetical protein [Metapseudomonas furukawaii]|uniref:Uncharacterized protein n=1 Tax=Metapseudomonas furukawaii TaxID=1149133 RepID=A0AAD1C3G6_METFU|nr:hypothetical protein [Pseudomonas furukawaii]ELS25693.1 phage-related hypothetical protein [Pseudomonas furukawaii]BAU76118.1 phage-related hypothetical protein [Pseudomonas furukawaii]